MRFGASRKVVVVVEFAFALKSAPVDCEDGEGAVVSGKRSSTATLSPLPVPTVLRKGVKELAARESGAGWECR